MKIRMAESVRKWKLKYLKVWKNENSNVRKSGIYSFSILDFLLEIYYIYITNLFYVPFIDVNSIYSSNLQRKMYLRYISFHANNFIFLS